MIVVPDASATFEYLARTPSGEMAAPFFENAELIAPSNLDSELLNTTRRAVLRGLVTATRGELLLDQLMRWPIARVSARYLIKDAFNMRDNLSAGDALYVLVARRLRATLVTSDGRLARAPNLGVSVHYVPVA